MSGQRGYDWVPRFTWADMTGQGQSRRVSRHDRSAKCLLSFISQVCHADVQGIPGRHEEILPSAQKAQEAQEPAARQGQPSRCAISNPTHVNSTSVLTVLTWTAQPQELHRTRHCGQKNKRQQPAGKEHVTQ